MCHGNLLQNVLYDWRVIIWSLDAKIGNYWPKSHHLFLSFGKIISINETASSEDHLFQIFGQITHINRSAVIWRWKLDFCSLIVDESCSLPGENSILPRCKMAAKMRNMASWKPITRQTNVNRIFEKQPVLYRENLTCSY